MADPIIYVIPEQYYGGATPKKEDKKREKISGGISPQGKDKPSRSISPKLLFIIIVGVLFLATVVGATFYFVKQSKPAIQPVVVVQEEEKESIIIETEIPVIPEEPPADTGAPFSIEPSVPEIPSPVSSQDLEVDIDNDGLSLAEEALYKGLENEPDTDRDGFLDGHEVINLYNPSGIAPEKLVDAGFVKEYGNQILGYSTFIPKDWSIRDIDSGVAIIDGNGINIIEISIYQNINNLELEEWYMSDSLGAPGIDTFSQLTSNKFGVSGIKHPNSREGYFGTEQFIYSISLSSDQSVKKYGTTLNVLLNSFQIK